LAKTVFRECIQERERESWMECPTPQKSVEGVRERTKREHTSNTNASIQHAQTQALNDRRGWTVTARLKYTTPENTQPRNTQLNCSTPAKAKTHTHTKQTRIANANNTLPTARATHTSAPQRCVPMELPCAGSESHTFRSPVNPPRYAVRHCTGPPRPFRSQATRKKEKM
jgi:hypothetical protein